MKNMYFELFDDTFFIIKSLHYAFKSDHVLKVISGKKQKRLTVENIILV